MNAIIDVDKLNEEHQKWTHQWHGGLPDTPSSGFWGAIETNHRWNFQLWHEEDIARRDDLPAERIRDAKRNIDRFNQARNNAMEAIDDCVLAWMSNNNVDVQAKTIHSETPGMMIDRLSIMALREYHMTEQTLRTDVEEAHCRRCADRVVVLKEQQADLTNALSDLLRDLGEGRRSFKVYRQFKMYNDPTLNPQLYYASKA